MPTGYTAGILDGEITSFQQFAKQCMRAFGATIHMRDDDMNAEYKPRTPSDYHKEQIDKAKQDLNDAKNLSDEMIILNKKAELEQDKKYHLKKIQEVIIHEKSLNNILQGVKNWQPPTDEHVGIKDFMIDQLVKTIDFDCNIKYNEEKLSCIEDELSKINADNVRKEMIDEANKELLYHTDELNKEIERCNQSNQWVTDFLKSL